MKLTIVICTHNRSELLLKTLYSIYKADIPADVDMRLLVIPNACSDNTMNTLEAFQKAQVTHNLTIQVVEEPRAGKSYALNKALSLIREGGVIFIDDDQRLDEEFFQAVVAAITRYPDTHIFCGKMFPDWTGDEPAWVHEQGDYKITPIPLPEFDLGDSDLLLTEKSFIPSGGNLIIDYQVFEKIGNFSESLGPTGHNFVGSEDTDLLLRALSVHEKIRYIPTIIQYHYVDLLRFKLNSLLLMNFQRNRSIMKIHQHEDSKIPNYLWLKLAKYSGHAVFSFNVSKTRFYLYKSAAIAGQIMGIIQSRPSV